MGEAGKAGTGRRGKDRGKGRQEGQEQPFQGFVQQRHMLTGTGVFLTITPPARGGPILPSKIPREEQREHKVLPAEVSVCLPEGEGGQGDPHGNGTHLEGSSPPPSQTELERA